MKLGDVKPRVGRERVDLDDVLEMVKLPKGKWVTVRILPLDVLPIRRHWVNIIAGKDKREVKIPKICVSFDPATEQDKKGFKCPYCGLADGPEQFYLANVIVRSEQEDAPARIKMTAGEKESGFKETDSDSWTPVKILRITSSLAKKIQGLKDLNKVKSKKTGDTKSFDISDERFGCDINVKYDADAKGADKYQIQLGQRAPMTEEEQGYLVWELTESILDQIGRESQQEAESEFKRMEIVGEDDLDEDDEDMSLGKKAKKPASKVDLDDDDEPVVKKKPAPKKKVDDDLDDDDDEPVVKKKPAPKKKVVDDEDDEDDDDLDDDDDEPVVKKKPAPKKKVDDDLDDDDEPVVKKKPAPKKKVVDDDDDLDDDDEPVVKKKPAPKKNVVDDEIDDDDVPF